MKRKEGVKKRNWTCDEKEEKYVCRANKKSPSEERERTKIQREKINA